MNKKIIKIIFLCLLLISMYICIHIPYSKPTDLQMYIMYIILIILLTINIIIEKERKRIIKIIIFTLVLGLLSYSNFKEITEVNYRFDLHHRGLTCYCVAILILVMNIIICFSNNKKESLKGENQNVRND